MYSIENMIDFSLELSSVSINNILLGRPDTNRITIIFDSAFRRHFYAQRSFRAGLFPPNISLD